MVFHVSDHVTSCRAALLDSLPTIKEFLAADRSRHNMYVCPDGGGMLNDLILESLPDLEAGLV